MKKNAKLITLIFIFSLGFLLRIHAYLVNNSFFVDEILLAFNVIFKSYPQLLSPLQYSQAAPFLFLFLTKLITSKLGFGELAFRLIPFLSSIASVVAFYFLTKKVFDNFRARILALFLFCINFQLLFYTQVFKPYSSDILITVLILLTAFSIDMKKIKWQHSFILGVLSSIAFCFSFTALFVILGVIFVHLCFSKAFKNTTIFFLPNLTALIWYSAINLNTITHSNYLNEYWANGFNILGLEIYKINYNFLFSFYNYPLFFIFLLIIGIVWLYKSDKFKTFILISPIIITFIAAAFKIYPFERRLILFLLPIFLIFIVIPFDKVKFDKNFLNILVIIVSLVFFINYAINYSTSFIVQRVSYLRQDVKPLLKILINEKKKDDILYIYYGSNPSYMYYSILMPIPKENLYKGIMLENNQNPLLAIEKDLLSIPKHKTVWLFFVKGNFQYEKDIKLYRDWVYKNGTIKKDIILKSARLIEMYL